MGLVFACAKTTGFAGAAGFAATFTGGFAAGVVAGLAAAVAADFVVVTGFAAAVAAGFVIVAGLAAAVAAGFVVVAGFAAAVAAGFVVVAGFAAAVAAGFVVVAGLAAAEAAGLEGVDVDFAGTEAWAAEPDVEDDCARAAPPSADEAIKAAATENVLIVFILVPLPNYFVAILYSTLIATSNIRYSETSLIFYIIDPILK